VPRIVVATPHPAEFAELAAALAAAGLEAVPAAGTAAARTAYDQGGATHREQAVKRAQAFAAASGLPAVALATALQVYALDQGPGLHTHDYAGPGATDAANREKLLAAMKRVPAGQRIALFQASAAIALPGDDTVRAVSSTLECEVTPEERGPGGHSYDAVIQLQNRKTLAEMDDDERNRLGHRGMALKQLQKHLSAIGTGVVNS
jgi:XTP/dITP diphosphohydrolase